MSDSIMIVDDEIDSCQLLKSYVDRFFPGMRICPCGHSVEEGRRRILEHQPDIILLDIQMEDGTGFDLLDKIENQQYHIIFITAYDEYAIKAFKYNAIDYLLKPIDPDDFVNAVNKVKGNKPRDLIYEELNSILKQRENKNLNKITFSTQKEIISVYLENIVRIEGDGNYSTVYTRESEKFVVSKPLKEIENLLPSNPFCRIHQSHLINIDAVKKFLKEDGGYAVMETKDIIPISRRKKDLFMKMFLMS